MTVLQGLLAAVRVLLVVLVVLVGARDNRGWVARGRLWRSLNKSGRFHYHLPSGVSAQVVILPIPNGRTPGQMSAAVRKHLWSLHLKASRKGISIMGDTAPGNFLGT